MNVTQVTRGSHGKATIQWAETLLLSGEAPADVARLTGIKPGYARKIKYRLFSGEKADLLQPAREHDSEVIRDFVALKKVTELETPVTNVTETVKVTGRIFGTLDAVFYVTTATACAGFVTALHWWAAPVSLVYALILIDALRMAKDPTIQKTAERGQNAVFVLEIFVAMPAHIMLFNWAIWQNYKSLPFEILHRVQNGELVRENADKPFYVGCFLAALLCAAALYSVDTTIRITRERVKNLAR